MKIGNGKSTGRFTRKDFKLKDGDQVYRILPGLGDLADTNRWAVHYNVHWGYTTSDGKKKPFASPEKKNRETKMVEIPDAAKERLETLKAKLVEAQKSGNKAAADKLNSLVGRSADALYSLDANHFMNVIDAQGNIGVLKIRHKCKVALDALIKKLESAGTYPLSPEDGRYFVFTRSGMGNDTSFAVSVLQEELDVPGVGKVKRDKVHVLTDDVISRLANEAGKLDQLFPRPTAEDVQKIVDTSDLMTGVSTYLDEVFGSNNSTDTTSATTETPKTATTQVASVATAPVVAAVKVETPVAQTVTPQAAVVTKVATGKATVATTPKVAVEEMSQEAFLEALNNGTL